MSNYGHNNAWLEKIADGVGFSEGPIVDPHGMMYCSSLDLGKLFRITDTGAELICDTGGGANGARIGADGTIYIAQNGGRRAPQGPWWGPSAVGGIQRFTPDGELSWLTCDPVAPNDLCFGPDGMIYLTDPTRAQRTPHKGDDGRIWRLNPENGYVELLLSRDWFVNGIAFGPDNILYIADTWAGRIYSFTLYPDGLGDEKLFIQMDRGGPDGIAFDEFGNLVIGAISVGDGPGTIQTWSPEGELIDMFYPGEGTMYTNLAFTASNELLICDSSAGAMLLAHDWPARGLPLYPFR